MLNIIFYIAAAVAVVCTLMAVTRTNAVHALLYLIVSLLGVALVFFLLGAHFAAALEVIVYAGAIMVLFVFVVMLLDLGPRTNSEQRQWLTPGMWIGPALLAGVLLIELAWATVGLPPGTAASAAGAQEGPHAVGSALFGPYVLGVELASFLLLAGLVGAYHLARPQNGAEGDG